MNRAMHMEGRDLPTRTIVVTAGADVARGRVEVEVVAWGKDGERSRDALQHRGHPLAPGGEIVDKR